MLGPERSSQRKRPLRVLTLNLWNTFGPWERRRAEILHQIAELRPDVLCLQEVVVREGYDQGQDLRAAFQRLGVRYHLTYQGRPFEDGLLGNAVLSLEAPRSARHLDLPVLEAGEAARVLVGVELSGATVLTVHLSPHARQAGLRQEQCRRILAFARSWPGARVGRPVILSGDLNCGPMGPELAMLTGDTALGLVDAWAAAGAGDGATWLVENPFTPVDVAADDRFDYVLASPQCRVQATSLVGREPATGTAMSDHLGVCVDFE